MLEDGVLTVNTTDLEQRFNDIITSFLDDLCYSLINTKEGVEQKRKASPSLEIVSKICAICSERQNFGQMFEVLDLNFGVEAFTVFVKDQGVSRKI